MWQRARTLLTHCKHTHTYTHQKCEYVCVWHRFTVFQHKSEADFYRGNVPLIKMKVRWSKRRVKTSKRSAGSWINLGLNLLQTLWRQEFYHEPYQESENHFPSVVTVLICILICDLFHLFTDFMANCYEPISDKVRWLVRNELYYLQIRDYLKKTYTSMYKNLNFLVLNKCTWSKEMRWPHHVPMAHRWPTFPFVIPHISVLCKTAGC